MCKLSFSFLVFLLWCIYSSCCDCSNKKRHAELQKQVQNALGCNADLSTIGDVSITTQKKEDDIVWFSGEYIGKIKGPNLMEGFSPSAEYQGIFEGKAYLEGCCDLKICQLGWQLKHSFLGMSNGGKVEQRCLDGCGL